MSSSAKSMCFFENSQGWWLHQFPGQLVLLLYNLFHESSFFPISNLNLTWCNVTPFPFIPPAVSCTSVQLCWDVTREVLLIDMGIIHIDLTMLAILFNWNPLILFIRMTLWLESSSCTEDVSSKGCYWQGMPRTSQLFVREIKAKQDIKKNEKQPDLSQTW